MEDFSKRVVYPTVDQICEINRRMIEKYGGLFVPPDNLNNQGTLEYILYCAAYPFEECNTHLTLKEKATIIAHHIIIRHVFKDGNKRTACHVAWAFLLSNGVKVVLDASIVELTKAVASGDAAYSDLLEWLIEHQE